MLFENIFSISSIYLFQYDLKNYCNTIYYVIDHQQMITQMMHGMKKRVIYFQVKENSTRQKTTLSKMEAVNHHPSLLTINPITMKILNITVIWYIARVQLDRWTEAFLLNLNRENLWTSQHCR